MMTFSSVLAPTIEKYLTLKRALGRQYAMEKRVLACMDHSLAARHADLNAETFDVWCLTLQHLASGNRRGYMRQVRNLCLYRRRQESTCFVPDNRLFPPRHQVIRPHIFTDNQLARLLEVARTLERTTNSPICRENMRLAIVLLYTFLSWRAWRLINSIRAIGNYSASATAPASALISKDVPGHHGVLHHPVIVRHTE